MLKLQLASQCLRLSHPDSVLPPGQSHSYKGAKKLVILSYDKYTPRAFLDNFQMAGDPGVT
jgi:hypothetical protein